jgi:hypothetical protein
VSWTHEGTTDAYGIVPGNVLESDHLIRKELKDNSEINLVEVVIWMEMVQCFSISNVEPSTVFKRFSRRWKENIKLNLILIEYGYLN